MGMGNQQNGQLADGTVSRRIQTQGKCTYMATKYNWKRRTYFGELTAWPEAVSSVSPSSQQNGEPNPKEKNGIPLFQKPY